MRRTPAAIEAGGSPCRGGRPAPSHPQCCGAAFPRARPSGAVAVVTWPGTLSHPLLIGQPHDVGTSTRSVGFFGGTYGTSLPMSLHHLGSVVGEESLRNLSPWLALSSITLPELVSSRPFQGAPVMHQQVPAPASTIPMSTGGNAIIVSQAGWLRRLGNAGRQVRALPFSHWSQGMFQSP